MDSLCTLGSQLSYEVLLLSLVRVAGLWGWWCLGRLVSVYGGKIWTVCVWVYRSSMKYTVHCMYSMIILMVIFHHYRHIWSICRGLSRGVLGGLEHPLPINFQKLWFFISLISYKNQGISTGWHVVAALVAPLNLFLDTPLIWAGNWVNTMWTRTNGYIWQIQGSARNKCPTVWPTNTP